MRGGSPIGNRRGMSPLIATVLLMAFAVALGGMIMNWSIDATTKTGDCDSVQIDVNTFCATDDHIRLSMRNNPEGKALRGIKIHIVDAAVDTTLAIRDSALAQGQPLEVEIPAVTGMGSTVDILAVVGPETNPFTCTEPAERAEPIQRC